MKKILLFGYLTNNLGDDLLIRTYATQLSPNASLAILDMDKRFNDEFISDLSNTYVLSKSFFTKSMMRNRMLIKIRAKVLSMKYDELVVIGGSMFIEENWRSASSIFLNSLISNFKSAGKKTSIKGANFGPHQSKKFVETTKSLLEKCTTVYFRDKESYEYFDKLNNVKLGTDLAFALDLSKYKSNSSSGGRYVVINPIDLSRREELARFESDYIESLVNQINELHKKGIETVLMSFCNFENDMRTIRILEKSIDPSLNSTYSYEGNLVEALSILGRASLIVGSRFHAMILAIILNKPIVIYSYSQKIENFISKIYPEVTNKILKISDIDTYSNISTEIRFPEELSSKLSLLANKML